MTPNTTATPLLERRRYRLRTLLNRQIAGWPLWLLLFALQFPLFQLATGVEYGDAPKNLHWGLYLSEQPRFLLDVTDRYELIRGFLPDPPSLATMGLAGIGGATLHNWWGPLLPSTWALLWRLTGSYTVLRLTMPLAALACVLVVYALARRLATPTVAGWTALLVAWLPLFREHAVLAYSETCAALIITSAFLAFLSERRWWAAVLGLLAVLIKIDLALLYLGSIGLASGWVWWRHGQRPNWRIVLPAALPAAIGFGSWMLLRYGLFNQHNPMPIRFQPEVFGYMSVQMVEQFVSIPWYGALLVIAALIACANLGRQGLVALPPLTRALLVSWAGLGLLVLAVYSITRGASNSPRVLLPAWPPLAFVIALGIVRLSPDWFRRITFFLLVLLSLINVVTMGYQVYQAQRINQFATAWAYLRTVPSGVVLNEEYWSTALYGRQPTTWFESDPVFQQNMLQNRANFDHYVKNTPIRYVLIARDDTLFSADVRDYLTTNAIVRPMGASTLYELKK